MWIFGFSLGVCSMELHDLVSFLEYLVSNGRQVLLGGIRLGGSTIGSHIPMVAGLEALQEQATYYILS